MSEAVARTELISPEPAAGLSALLDVPLPDLAAGEPLPVLWHWLYLLDRVAQNDLGFDGHPARRTIPVPPGPGLRRMWAGGEVRTNGGLVCGEPATRHTRVIDSEEKVGRSGPLTFLTVEHLITQRDRLVVEERQQLVYRDAARQTATASEVLTDVPTAPDEWSIDVTPVLLFRFSALTFNAHRIHYDRDYARDEEGYPGLVTHGPLQAVAMAEAARGRDLATGRPSVRQSFAYTLTSPLFEFQGLLVGAVPDGAGYRTWVRDRHGRETASGTLH